MADKWYTHKHTPKSVSEHEDEIAYGIKGYTQTEKLQQTGQIE